MGCCLAKESTRDWFSPSTLSMLFSVRLQTTGHIAFPVGTNVHRPARSEGRDWTQLQAGWAQLRPKACESGAKVAGVSDKAHTGCWFLNLGVITVSSYAMPGSTHKYLVNGLLVTSG